MSTSPPPVVEQEVLPCDDDLRRLLAVWCLNENKLFFMTSCYGYVEFRSPQLHSNGWAISATALVQNHHTTVTAPLCVGPIALDSYFSFKLTRRHPPPIWARLPVRELARCVRRMDKYAATVSDWPMPRELCLLVVAYAPPWDYGHGVVLETVK